ncbi:MAG: hypothetical protein ACTSR8_21035 [Promethearchaeota archaeon]
MGAIAFAKENKTSTKNWKKSASSEFDFKGENDFPIVVEIIRKVIELKFGEVTKKQEKSLL